MMPYIVAIGTASPPIQICGDTKAGEKVVGSCLNAPVNEFQMVSVAFRLMSEANFSLG